MQVVKFYDVNNAKHVMFEVEGNPSAGDCLIAHGNGKIVHYKVISTEELTDMEISQLELLEDLEDIPEGIIEITNEQFCAFVDFAQSTNGEYNSYVVRLVNTK